VVVSNIFVIFTPTWGRCSNLTSIFFKWVGSTTTYIIIFCLQEMKKLLQLTIKKMQLRPEVPLAEGCVKRFGPRGVIKWDPTFGGIKLDANVWQFSEISL